MSKVLPSGTSWQANGLLRKSAEKIRQSAGLNGLSHLVLFPNSRGAIQFLETYSSLLEGEPAILPIATSLDNWVFSHTLLEPVTQEEAIVVLFEQFRKFRNPEEELVNFQSLGKILLDDYELIIRAGRKPEEVFGHLHAWASAGSTFADFLGEEDLVILRTFASHFEGSLSQSRERFLSLWKAIPGILNGFEHELLDSGRCTSAMAYREVLHSIRTGKLALSFEKIWFVGFGNLSETEIQLMELLMERGKADWVWDFPAARSGPCSGEIQRLVSRLQRRANASFGSQLDSRTPVLTPDSTEIQADSLPVLIQWISQQQMAQNWGEETAIIALDPVVYPLLDSLQEDGAERFQFSLGFPLAYTAQVRWLERVLNAKQSELRLPADLWQDPILPESLRLGSLPSVSIHSAEASTFLFQLLNWLETGIQAEPLPALVWIHIVKTLKELIRLLAPIPESEWSIELFRNFLGTLYNQFPLQTKSKSSSNAVQVTGLYETKVLNFKRIVVLPANEGSFPGSQQANSFLPESIRKAFRIASRADRQEDEMYQLGRLFFQAEEVWFLSLTNQESKRSRVLNQLEYSDLPLRKVPISASGFHQIPLPFEIEKEEAFHQFWDQYRIESPSQKVFSPSSLHELLRCEMAFYFDRFRKIEAPESPTDLEMSPLDFGNWIHESIQFLYEQHCTPGQVISAELYKKMAAKWDEVQIHIWNGLRDKESTGDLSRYRIEQRIAAEMVQRYFRCMMAFPEHSWLKNEYEYKPVRIGTKEEAWMFGGRVDIVVETPTEIRILDLKTGGAKLPADLRAVSSRNPGFSEKKLLANKDVFQMVMYERLARLEPSFKGKTVKAGLVHLANPATEWVPPLGPIQGDSVSLDAYFQSFDQWILAKLESFGNPEVPVRQTDEEDFCSFCDFKAICQR